MKRILLFLFSLAAVTGHMLVAQIARDHETNALGSVERRAWMEQLQPGESKVVMTFDAKKWALETHKIACAQVYGTLGEPYGARGIKLQQKYVDEAVQTARGQIVLAGYRLAALLNELYGK